MVRTKKTAHILCELQIEASASSSEDDVDENSGSSRSREEATNASKSEIVPNGQDTFASQDDTVKNSGDKSCASDAGEEAQRTSTQGDDSDDDPGSSEQTSGASRGSRERAFVDCNDELYYVPPLKTSHRSWDAFDTYFGEVSTRYAYRHRDLRGAEREVTRSPDRIHDSSRWEVQG
ncbi:unnamed protein product [Phytophthora fragariaefolia]|uniref:Unnamed protein product n=1 Tax=Phytophthora fragariaefolia TaxID=1490495 RepID=A0A9W6YRF4_9STRA|nr:unnamed protein product [Phytophthora fragariaefolia]